MVFAPGPLAPISPQASLADAVKNDVNDDLCIAEVACEPLEQDRGRRHARSALHADTLKPAIGGRVGAAQPVIRPFTRHAVRSADARGNYSNVA
jgi:hypothetical protein